jgi:hypoxanthine phosphoribosyltransferase
MQFEYVSWARFYRLCGTLYRRIDAAGFRPDLIVAIARGGYPVARVLADYFGIMDLFSLKIEHYRGPDKLPSAVVRYPLPVDIEDRRVLLVDDVSDSGDTFEVALAQLRQGGAPRALRTAVLHHKHSAALEPDYYAQRVLKWRWITYPWALVEDLSVLAARLEPLPDSTARLAQRLGTELAFPLPRGLWPQIGPIVLARAAELCARPSGTDNQGIVQVVQQAEDR